MTDRAIESIDQAMEHTEVLKKLGYNTYCIDDSLFHLRRAREALVDGLPNPDVWVKEEQDAMKALLAILPYVILFTHPRYALESTVARHQ